MEQRIVSKEESKYIYWIKNNEDEFYLTIPATKKANLLINLQNSVDDENVKIIMEDNNHIIVTPKISQEQIMGLKQNSAEVFTRVAEALARDINLSHQVLTYNHIELNTPVLLKSNQEFSMFQTWFVKGHNGKVVLKESNQVSVRPPEPIQQVAPVPPVESEQVQKNTNTLDELDVQDTPVSKTQEGSMGFVSYVLLGVVVMIASLLFLYFIL